MTQPAPVTLSGAQVFSVPQWRRVWRLFRVVVHIVYGLLLALVTGAFWRPYRPLVRRATNHWLNALLVILNIQIEYRGLADDRPALWVANHISWLDIVVLRASHELYFLSKAEVREWPLIGHLAAAAGTLFIRRGSGESGRKAAEIAEHLRAGRTVLVFPEGTSTRGDSVRRFFPQLFSAAQDAAVAVQPVALSYPAADGRADPELAFIGNDAFHTHLWRLLLRDRITVRLNFCEPLMVEEVVALPRDQLARESRARIEGHI